MVNAYRWHSEGVCHNALALVHNEALKVLVAACVLTACLQAPCAAGYVTVLVAYATQGESNGQRTHNYWG